jgi:hypothetical protein
MKLALTVAALALAAAISSTAGAAGTTGDYYSCKLKKFKADGFPAVTTCGPATATLTLAGRSYSFKNGVCSISSGTGNKRVLFLEIGTVVKAPASSPPPTAENYGYPYFTITTMGTIASVVAVYQGKVLTGQPGPSLFNFEKTYTGTFTSRGDSGPKYSGSWNCHGVSVRP